MNYNKTHSPAIGSLLFCCEVLLGSLPCGQTAHRFRTSKCAVMLVTGRVVTGGGDGGIDIDGGDGDDSGDDYGDDN